MKTCLLCTMQSFQSNIFTVSTMELKERAGCVAAKYWKIYSVYTSYGDVQWARDYNKGNKSMYNQRYCAVVMVLGLKGGKRQKNCKILVGQKWICVYWHIYKHKYMFICILYKYICIYKDINIQYVHISIYILTYMYKIYIHICIYQIL